MKTLSQNAYTASARGTTLAPQDGVLPLKGSIEERAQDLALYIIEHKATVRAAAVAFGVSKSTVHTELPKRNGIYGRFAECEHNILWLWRE